MNRNRKVLFLHFRWKLTCLFHESYQSAIHLDLFFFLPSDFEGNVRHVVTLSVCYPDSTHISPRLSLDSDHLFSSLQNLSDNTEW